MSNETKWSGIREITILVTALLILAGFAAFVYYALGALLDAPDLRWTRAVYLLSGVEAVVFAAAGFLFGRDVNRSRAENAEVQLNEARKEVRAAEEKNSKGKALALAVLAKADNLNRTKGQLYGTLAVPEATQYLQADLQELTILANQIMT